MKRSSIWKNRINHSTSLAIPKAHVNRSGQRVSSGNRILLAVSTQRGAYNEMNLVGHVRAYVWHEGLYCMGASVSARR